MSKKIFVVSPHADDLELGCGGYIAKQAYQGAEVSCLIMAAGDNFHPHLGRIVTAEERIEEARAAMGVLGVPHLDIALMNKDGYLDTVPQRELIREIEHAIAKNEPDEILIPLPSSHQDHIATYQASVAATRPSARNRVRLIAAYEYTASSWNGGPTAESGRGGLYVDISEWFDLKAEALRCHKTQMRNGRHCWSIDSAESLARMRGLESGLDKAELLYVMRELG